MINKINIETFLKSNAQIEGFEYNENSINKEISENNFNKISPVIKVLTVFGSFIATIFLVGFLFIAGIYNSPTAALICGVLFITAAILGAKFFNYILVYTTAITTYLAGICLVYFGLYDITESNEMVQLTVVFIAIITLLITNNYFLIFISCGLIFGNIYYMIGHNTTTLMHYYFIAFIALLILVISLKEASIIAFHPKLNFMYQPFLQALVLTLLGLLYFTNNNFSNANSNIICLAASIPIMLLLLYMNYLLLFKIGISSNLLSALVYAVSILAFTSLVFAPTILGAIFVIIISFYTNQKICLYIAIFCVFYFIGKYYYDLSFTLLTKSILMIATGILFSVLYLLVHKKIINDKI